MPHGADAQPDVRRVGGGRARTSPPPTAQHKPASLLVSCVFVILGTLPETPAQAQLSCRARAAGHVALGAKVAKLPDCSERALVQALRWKRVGGTGLEPGTSSREWMVGRR